MKNPGIVVCSLLVLSGCAKTDNSEGVLPSYQRQALERAGEVEGQLQSVEDKRREQSDAY